MPVPYMGSKRGSASKIISVIKAHYPEVDTIYDLFCGGFAISEEALLRGYNVRASDLNEAMINLIRELLYGECIDEKTGKSIFEYPRFISRKEFYNLVDKQTWFAGYVKCVWSFGNNNKGYLYSPENEKLKKAAHDLIVDGKLSDDLPISKIIQKRILGYKTFQGRRKAMGNFARATDSEYRTIELERLRSLENLQHLRSLENLQHLRSLENLSYTDAVIEPNAIIYCDPPYIGTAEYIANDDTTFDHQRFYRWVRDKAKTNPVFISEYHCPDDFKCVYEFERRQLLSKGNTKYNEKLFFVDNRKKEA